MLRLAFSSKLHHAKVQTHRAASMAVVLFLKILNVLCKYVRMHDCVCMFCRSQWSGQPKRFLVSSCLVWGSQSGHRLHCYQQVPREALRLRTGDCFLEFHCVCQHTDTYTYSMTGSHTYVLLALLPYLVCVCFSKHHWTATMTKRKLSKWSIWSISCSCRLNCHLWWFNIEAWAVIHSAGFRLNSLMSLNHS